MQINSKIKVNKCKIIPIKDDEWKSLNHFIHSNLLRNVWSSLFRK